jgi:peptidoglycan hydrolase-like protein with peptidoglycan-binding domain
MLLASKVVCAGIAFILLATGISGPRPTTPVSGPNLSKEVLAVEDRNDIKKLQETLRDNGHYRGEVDGVLGLRTRASIRTYQRAENLPVTGELDAETAGNSESDHRATRRLGTRLHKVNLRLESSGIGVRGEARHYRRQPGDRTLQSRRRSVVRPRRNIMESMGV